jgi:hypothetical protein
LDIFHSHPYHFSSRHQQPPSPPRCLLPSSADAPCTWRPDFSSLSPLGAGSKRGAPAPLPPARTPGQGALLPTAAAGSHQQPWRPCPLLFHGARQELLPWPPTPYSPPWPALELHSSPWRRPPWRSLPAGEQAGSSSPPPFFFLCPALPLLPGIQSRELDAPVQPHTFFLPWPSPPSIADRTPSPASGHGALHSVPSPLFSPLVAHELLGPTSARSMSMAPSSSPLPVHGRQPLLLFTEPSSSSLPLPRSLVAQRAPSPTYAASCALQQQP